MLKILYTRHLHKSGQSSFVHFCTMLFAIYFSIISLLKIYFIDLIYRAQSVLSFVWLDEGSERGDLNHVADV